MGAMDAEVRNSSFNNSFKNVSFNGTEIKNLSFGGRSFNASFNASFGSQAALELSSDLKNMSFGSQSNTTLVSEWQFWFDSKDESMSTPTNIRQALGVISTIRLFWWFYKKLQPSALPSKVESVQFFKNGVEPTWGHERNRHGGHYKMVCKTKGHLQRLWLDVCLVLVGGQLNHPDAVNGADYNIEKKTVCFWMADAEDEETKQDVRKQLVKMLPSGSTIAFKDHASLLGKESAMTVSADIIESETTIKTQTKENAKLSGIAAELVPPAHLPVQRPTKQSEHGGEVVDHDAPAVLVGRPRSSSEVATRQGCLSMSFDEAALPRRGRSLSRIEIRPRERSPITMRKTLSADALDEYIPSESIHTAVPGMPHVTSWADDEDSQLSSPAAPDFASVNETAFVPLQQGPIPQGTRTTPQLLSPHRPLYDQGDLSHEPHEYQIEWEPDQSGPPSLAHSAPTSPQHPGHHGVPHQQSAFDMSGVVNEPKEAMGMAFPRVQQPPQTQEQLRAQLDQILQQQMVQGMQELSPRGMHSRVHPVHAQQQFPLQQMPGGKRMPAIVQPWLLQANMVHQQQAHQRQQPQPQAVHLPNSQMQNHHQFAMQMQQNGNGMRRQMGQQGMGQPGMAQFAHQQHQQQHHQHQQLPHAAPGANRGRVRGGIVPGGPAGHVYGQQLPQGHGFDVPPIMDYLLAKLEREEEKAAEEEQSKFSKSRSPRNRRKIRERKIREAACAAKREMELLCPLFEAPDHSWVSTLENKYITKPDSFQPGDWYRFVQACKKEQVNLVDLKRIPADVMDKLGATQEVQRQGVYASIVKEGPTPHPFLAVVAQMEVEGAQSQQGMMRHPMNGHTSPNFLAPPQSMFV